jgi:hypothetical protein
MEKFNKLYESIISENRSKLKSVLRKLENSTKIHAPMADIQDWARQIMNGAPYDYLATKYGRHEYEMEEIYNALEDAGLV